jgi:hypothetical protein
MILGGRPNSAPRNVYRALSLLDQYSYIELLIPAIILENYSLHQRLEDNGVCMLCSSRTVGARVDRKMVENRATYIAHGAKSKTNPPEKSNSKDKHGCLSRLAVAHLHRSGEETSMSNAQVSTCRIQQRDKRTSRPHRTSLFSLCFLGRTLAVAIVAILALPPSKSDENETTGSLDGWWC